MILRRFFSYNKNNKLQFSPPVTLLILYTMLMFTGAFLLYMPFASNKPTSFFSALFTSISAVTVTGLSVVDVGTHFNFFGQLVIVALVQLGGLGLMTFSILILAMLGMKIPISKHILLCEDLSQTDLGSLKKLVFMIFKVVFFVEICGAILLSLQFIPDFGWKRGLWVSIFHSVSAFNNAGFSLFSDSLVSYVTNPLINIVIPLLFILGGLGYPVLMDISDKKSWKKLTLHSKIMLTGSAFLIVFAFLFFLALEWKNPRTLGNLDFVGKIGASWFQSTTPRTAGFNTVDISALKDSTAFMMMPLMVIGGGSTSTAGGIKVTTFMIMILAVIMFFKRRDEILIYGRSLASTQILKVMALITISMLIILTGLFLITITNDLPFIDLMFEACSAFGTTGLSRGVTANLDFLGRLIVMILMFIGRVGPLTLGFFLATRSTPRVKYPSDNVLLV